VEGGGDAALKLALEQSALAPKANAEDVALKMAIERSLSDHNDNIRSHGRFYTTGHEP
jgi:hypothetical protein